MRAAQSKGIADLLALWHAKEEWAPGHPLIPVPWLVQCKHSIHGGGYLPGKEALELVELAALIGGRPVFARPGKNGRGVEFIDLTTKETIV